MSWSLYNHFLMTGKIFSELIDKLPEIVKALLADPEKMQAIADHGYAMALKYHSWAKRAETLHNYMEENE